MLLPSERRAFWPEAMLPAVFVTDDDLLVVSTNPPAADLLGDIRLRGQVAHSLYALFEDEMPTIEGAQSLWEQLIDPGDLSYVRELMRILNEHRKRIEEWNGLEQPASPREVEALFYSTQPSQRGVTIYAKVPREPAEKLIVGVKVAPPVALRLVRDVTQPRYIDIVAAWRLTCEWESGRVRSLRFHGIQPAFHDATERAELFWVEARRSVEADLTRLWSHALMSDLLAAECAARNAEAVYRYGQEEKKAATFAWTKKVYKGLSSHVGFLRIVRSLDESRERARLEPIESTEFRPLLSLVNSTAAVALERVLIDLDLFGTIRARNAKFADRLQENRDAWLNRLSELSDSRSDLEVAEGLNGLLRDMGIAAAGWSTDASLAAGVPFRAAASRGSRPVEAVTWRSLSVLFEEYVFNALKEVVCHDGSSVTCRIIVQKWGDLDVLEWSLHNSVAVSAKQHPLIETSKEVEPDSLSQKGLFTNYQIFTSIFADFEGAYSRSSCREGFTVRLLFPIGCFRFGGAAE